MSTSSLTFSFKTGTNQGSTGSPSIGARPNQEFDLVVPCIILEPKKKKMTPNLRVGFKERQHKHLSKALSATPSLVKRTRSEVSHEEPVLDAPTEQVPPSDTVRPKQELVVSSSAEDTCSAEDGTTVGHTPGGDINDKVAPINSPSQNEIVALLRQVPCFTMSESPAPGIDALFLLIN